MKISDNIINNIVENLSQDGYEKGELLQELYDEGIYKTKYNVSIENIEPEEIDSPIKTMHVIKTRGEESKMGTGCEIFFGGCLIELPRMSKKDKVNFIKNVIEKLPNFKDENEMTDWIDEEDFKLYKKSLGLD